MSPAQHNKLKVVAVGDLFVLAALWEEALHRHLDPLAQTVEVVTYEVDWPDTPFGKNEEVDEFLGDPFAIAALAADADAIVTHLGPVTEAMLASCPRVQIVGCSRGGLVNVNVEAATRRRIPVVHSPGRNSQSVIEFTLGLILSHTRGIARAHAVLREGVWEGHLCRWDLIGRELQGQTVGLVGFGAIAQGLVPYLKPFDLQLLAYDPYTPQERFDLLGVERVSLPDLLRRSDIVSLHARVTPETRGMIGAAELALMKPTATLINTARGPLLDYDALYAALSQGQIAGAALDTFAQEPPPADWPLLRLPNVTLTPHLGGASRSSAERGTDQVAEDVANFFAGRPLLRCVNARALGL